MFEGYRRYCPTCGIEMEYRIEHRHYDMMDSKSVSYDLFLACRAQGWWDIIWSGRHHWGSRIVVGISGSRLGEYGIPDPMKVSA